MIREFLRTPPVPAILLGYLVLINLFGFCIVWVDKRRARRQQWRIRERTLFLTAGIGGSVGVYLGMMRFRHKTQHQNFTIVIPTIIIVQLLLAFWLVFVAVG